MLVTLHEHPSWYASNPSVANSHLSSPRCDLNTQLTMLQEMLGLDTCLTCCLQIWLLTVSALLLECRGSFNLVGVYRPNFFRQDRLWWGC